MKLHGLKKLQCSAFADESQTECENISWLAHYANLQEYVPKPPAIITLLPLFRDGVHSPDMMNLVRQITFQVNPEQIPVFTVDHAATICYSEKNSVEMAG